ncbi:short chain dehydrogenase reductase [Grosmannia clavigera kw1407]|uniref:Short chain dehydrogenase reductase n=1 Tax=Grosmannia clavigera (strain kw1407 / UAMH 11150) TaxID=655863 RepID=F0X7Q0_GROCL|nr:short chain dehydrogenase reductase [Grosmannia clavigera kw1407]EFX06668.1 short chain dehydrogenase reductase [Grosmannia clavigera kw1407]
MFQPSIPPTPSGISLAGQTIIVTGGNSGVGFEAARQFLVLGAARLIITSRSASRGATAVAALKADPEVQLANGKAVIEAYELELADYRSGQRFVDRVRAEVPELDVLLANAGQFVTRRENVQSAAGGHERNMQVNCYTHLLICLELLPLLVATARARGVQGRPARITFTGSATHVLQETLTNDPVRFDAGETVIGHFDDPTHFSRLNRYADTKLCINAHVRKLAALTDSPDLVIVNNVCPGLLHATHLDDSLPFYLRYPTALARLVAGRSVQQGARTLVYAAVVGGPETNGTFLQQNKIHPGAKFLNTADGQKFIDALWTESVADCAKFDSTLGKYSHAPIAL